MADIVLEVIESISEIDLATSLRIGNFYIDPVSGDDSTGDGSKALPWKTITLGATVARITAGDEIRIKKNTDPVSLGDATWTNDSNIVTLDTARTINICDCNSAWTASVNVSQDVSTDEKYALKGNAQKFTIASLFSTGKITYYNLGSSIDFSDYQKISFGFNLSVDTAANVFSIRLCSDTSGDTAVDTLIIPYALGYDVNCLYPQRIVLDKGSALGDSIQSVAIYAESDPGAVVIYIDQIIATNDLSHQSLIGKNDGEWYSIKSIDGTEIQLSTSSTYTNVKYYGTEEETTTYHISDWVVFSPAAYNTALNTLNDSGTSTDYIKYRGGWNFTSDSQDGYTNFLSVSTLGDMFYSSSKTYNRVERFRINGSYRGIHLSSSTLFQISDICFALCSNGSIANTSTSTISNMEGTIFSYHCGIMNILPDSELNITADITIASSIGTYGIGITNSLTYVESKGTLKLLDSSTAYGLYINCSYVSITAIETNGSYPFYAINCGKGVIDYLSGSSVKFSTVDTYSFWRIGMFRIGRFISADTTFDSNFMYDPSSTLTSYARLSIDSINDDATKYITYSGGGRYGDQDTLGYTVDWAYPEGVSGGEEVSICMDPISLYYPLTMEAHLLVEGVSVNKIKFMAKKSSSSANCTLYISVTGCGIINPIYNEQITLTDEWIEYISSLFEVHISGYVRILFTVYDGASSGDVGIDTLDIEEQYYIHSVNINEPIVVTKTGSASIV